MRLLSKLVLSYAAVATALTNVGFGGKRESYKHLQELDLGLDCDSHRLGAVAIAFVLGAQNLAAIPGGAPNLALARLAGWEYWLRGDPIATLEPRRSLYLAVATEPTPTQPIAGAVVILKYMVGYLEAAVAEARPLVLVHGEGALVARFENLHVDFDATATPPVYNDTMTKFMKSVKGRSITAPLRFSLVPVGKALFKAGLDTAALPDVLARVAKYLPDRAHDIAFTKRVGSAEPIRVGSAFTRERFVTTPVAWTRVADAATIAALQVPGADGTKFDVFPSSVAVAREVGQYLHDHL